MKNSDSRESFRATDGFVVIDKPKGPTSHQVDHWVRKILGVDKVGHIGTLDPNAVGVLVMAVGKAVKLIDIAHEAPKEYICAMRIHSDLPEERIKEVMKELETEVYQIPPMKSAVAREVRSRRIYELELLETSGKIILFRAKTDSGTYIRTLCVDMGYLLGTGSQMSDLRRVSTGVFREDRYIVTLQDLKDSVDLMKKGDDRMLREIFLPLNYLFKDMPKIVVKKSAIENIAHGADLYPGGIKSIAGDPRRKDRVCVLSENNDLIGTGIMLVSASEISDLKVVDFDRVMVDPHTSGKKAKSQAAKKERKVEVFHERERKSEARGAPRGKVVRNSGRKPSGRGVQGPSGKVPRDFRRPEGRKDTRDGSFRGKGPGAQGTADRIRKKKSKG